MTSSSIRGVVFLLVAGLAGSARAQTAPPPAELPPASPEPAPPPAAEPGAMPDVRPTDMGTPPPSASEPEVAPEDESPIPEAPHFPKKRVVSKREKLSHKYQLGASGLVGKGYRVIFPYDDKLTCGDASGEDTKRVCTSFSPVFIDIQPSFGVTDNLDLITDLRFGLSADFTNHKQLVVAPGIRYWVEPDAMVKFYTTAQVAWDHTPQDQMKVKTDDIALRNSNGMMIDVLKNFGIFIQLGETIGFRRWLRFELDGGAGLQLRVP